MKKAAVFILIICITAAFAACSEPLAEGRDGFLSPSVIFEEFEKAKDDFLSVAVAPASDSELSGRIEWTVSDEDAENTVYPNAEITGAYLSDGGILGASVMTFAGGLDIYKDKDGLILNKTGMNSGASLSGIISKYIALFCSHTEESDYKTLADNIRVSDADEEVSRITLTLPKERAAETIRSVADAFRSDVGSYDFMHALLSLFSDTYGTEQNGRQLLEDVILSSLYKAADGADGDLVWVRYVKDGKTVSENLTVPTGGSVFDICCTCTVYDKETEIKFFINKDTENRLCDLYALFRRGDLSDTYRIQAGIGGSDYVAAVTGEVRSAYKSGSAEIGVFRSGAKAKDKGGTELYLSYDANKGLKYSGNGSMTVNGKTERFTVSFGFSRAENVTPPEKPPVTENAAEFFSTLMDTVGDSFPDVKNFLTGEDR